MSEAAVAARPRWWWIAGSAILLFAAWRIVVLATDPERQLEAALEAAQSAIDDGRLDDATRLAREALRMRQLDGRPYRQLAQVAAAQEDGETAARMAELAVRHAPRDPIARAMAAQHALERGDWPTAVNHYDRLLRVTPGLAPNVFPVLGALAGPAESRAALVASLAGEPPWRAAFLRDFARTAPEPAPLFRELRQGIGLTQDEAAAYVGRYVADGRWGEAFAAWAGLLPAEVITRLTTPMDGGFEAPMSEIPPFSWEIRAPKGVEAAIRRHPEGEGSALRVQFLGRRSAFHHVRQLMLLPVGHYVLAWRRKLDGLQAARGLRWTVTCADGARARIIATNSEAGSSPWADRAEAFAVPAGCSAQWLVLELEARIAAETLATGAAWFDDVRVLPAADDQGES